MKLLILGGTGFIGKSLVPALCQQGFDVTLLARDVNKALKLYSSSVKIIALASLDSLSPDTFDAVINLAGENIAGGRWTSTRKLALKDSRIQSTKKLVAWISRASHKMPHLYNASAIGIYGAHTSSHTETKPFTEMSSLASIKKDFCRELVEEWEQSASPSKDLPVTFLRFGVVLKKNDGMLNKLEIPFQFGLGTIIGNGQQSLSWIHINDLVNAIIFLLKNPEIVGPVNVCAPHSVSQREFAEVLAEVLGRPLFLKMPAFAVKALFGEMGEELLLSGQDVYPEVLIQKSFEFTYPQLLQALQHEYTRSK